MDIIASEATLRLTLDPEFTLSGVSRGQPVARRAASHPFERSMRRFLGAVSQHDPGASGLHAAGRSRDARGGDRG